MNLAVDYVKHGLALVPIPLGTKGPVHPGWNLPEHAITTIDAAAKMTGNVGLLHLLSSPPSVSIDLDDLDSATQLLGVAGVDINMLLGAQDAVQISSGRANRAKLLYRLPANIPSLETIQIEDPDTGKMLLELRCVSRNGTSLQDLLPPSIHPETGKEYTWAGRGHWTKLPELPPVLLDYWNSQLQIKGKGQHSNSAGSDSDSVVTLPPETIQHLRSALHHMRSDSRSHWVKVGMALFELVEVGRGLWLEWSATSEKFDAADAAKTWDSLKPTAIGYEFVFAEAQRQGWINPTKRHTNTHGIFAHSAPPQSLQARMPQQLPGTLKPVPTLNPDSLPDALRDAAVDIADRLQCPIDYIVVAMLSAAGTIIGNQIGIYPLANDESWKVFPCLWGGIVGPPGSKKSPALNAALAPLTLLEEQARDRFKMAFAKYKADGEQYKIDLAAWKKKASPTLPMEPEEPIPERYVVHDTTYQKLGEILANNPRGVLALSDELSGLLQSLDTPGQEAARGFYLTGWGGNSGYSFDRIGRGSIVLSRYCLSVFGGFQPDKIKSYVKHTQSGNSKNDGMLQRFQLLVWPDLVRPTGIIDRTPDEAALEAYHNAMLNLPSTVSGMAGRVKHGAHGQPLMHFDSDAQKLFISWYETLEAMLSRSNLDSARQSHYAKYRSLIPALALIFHLLDGQCGSVGVGNLAKAIRFAIYLKGHAARIYASVSGADHTSTNALARKILKGGLRDGFTCRTVYTKGWSGISTKASAQGALDVLVEYGWLLEQEKRSGGRPTVAYRVNAGVSAALLCD